MHLLTICMRLHSRIIPASKLPSVLSISGPWPLGWTYKWALPKLPLCYTPHHTISNTTTLMRTVLVPMATKGVILALGLAAVVIQAMTTINPRGFTAFVGKTTKALLPALKPGVDLGLRAMQALVAYPAYVVIASIAHKKSPGAPLWTALVLVLAVAAVGWRREVWWSHWSHFLSNPDLRVVCVTILGAFALAAIQRVVKGYLGRGRKAGEAKSK